MNQLMLPTHGSQSVLGNELEAARARMERIAKIRASIRASSYCVPAEKLADKMSEHKELWEATTLTPFPVS